MAGAEQRKARDSMKKGAFRLERSFLFSIKTMFAPNLHLDNHNPLFLLSVLVRMERLELSHLAAPEPKSGASTNFATSAFCESADSTVLRQNCKRFLAMNGRNVAQLKAFVGLQISPFALWQCAEFDAPDADAF